MAEPTTDDPREMPESYWQETLPPERYAVLRQAATERPFSGALYYNDASGMYACAACSQPLFTSETKIASGCGWPSFDDPVNRENVELREDRSHGMVRTEVLCQRCGSHLGHVFDDGLRQTTGQRYCINSLALEFRPEGR